MLKLSLCLIQYQLRYKKHATVLNSILSNKQANIQIMQYLQTKLGRFFKKSGGGDEDESECPNDDCVYDHTNSAQKYKKPMFWTQVLQVKLPVPSPIQIFDIEKDIQKD